LTVAEKATKILKEVKEAQAVFKKQRDLIKMESEVCIRIHVMLLNPSILNTFSWW